jgi:hypothetical protein
MDDATELELEERDYLRPPLAEFGQALINISNGSPMWDALAQAAANVSNHEGNPLRQRLRYERLCAFFSRMDTVRVRMKALRNRTFIPIQQYQ